MSDSPKNLKIPVLRHRFGQALVTLTDAVTKRRRDFYLGPQGTPASRELYFRVIAEWEAAGRRWPMLQPDTPTASDPNALSVGELVRRYWHWAKGYYHYRRAGALKGALRLLRKYYGHTPATDFGPRKLRLLRDEMVRGDPNPERPRRPWSRKYVNSQVQCLRHVFKWAAARELAPVTVHQALCTLEPLKRGRTTARENRKVGPVPQHLLDATLPHLNDQVRALVELQRLTGARPGELLGLRPCDLQMDNKRRVWTCRPEQHKNAFREQERVLYFGPRAQDILNKYVGNRPTTAYLFSPAEAEAKRRAELHAERDTPLSCGNRPGTHRQQKPCRKPGDHYTTDSYRRAIEYACEQAFPPPGDLAWRVPETSAAWWKRLTKEQHAEVRACRRQGRPIPEALQRKEGETREEWMDRLTPEQKSELKAWRREHRWHPHQLRHNAATELRQKFGLEAAQLALGHASAQVTDAVYAERDEAKVVAIMRKIG